MTNMTEICDNFAKGMLRNCLEYFGWTKEDIDVFIRDVEPKREYQPKSEPVNSEEIIP